MNIVSVLKFFVVAITLALLYMLVTQEIHIGSRHGGLGPELITLKDSPVRFISFFLMLAAFDFYLIKSIRKMSCSE